MSLPPSLRPPGRDPRLRVRQQRVRPHTPDLKAFSTRPFVDAARPTRPSGAKGSLQTGEEAPRQAATGLQSVSTVGALRSFGAW